ncbi:NAD(P)H-dependent flavin oxidoreductase [Stakelama pacifica]|uniref:Nitronate monooxygenase n=1 Tax=Stakelama pacifica TaxID=517720 RepID=A0A4R6FDR6_9SPHN|nr:nitronate monooxygenase [Stakelama pacifica]TDN79312.1 nitronate monooxygenase [Stakelama pacifica]GGO98433.1 2-nitropropane dioxygenase [Stakelama pacifica]
MTLLERIGLTAPIFQAPMAGVATPALAAAVSEAGGLGALGLGASDSEAARAMIEETRARTDRAFHVNLFVHATPPTDAAREAAWLAALAPAFAEASAEPPEALTSPYTSLAEDNAVLAMLCEERPAVVSFHFGLPEPSHAAALREAGCLLLASVTSPAEALAAERAGMDAVIAQGYEAGGHRGMFDPDAPDDRLSTMALTRLLVRRSTLPVIAAGGIMDGAGIAAALSLGAVAAQLGTAFVACPESAADAGYRAALAGAAADHTIMTRAISGRPARCLANRFTRLGETLPVPVPDYPRAYHAGKALNAAHKAAGEPGYGAQWAGQGAPLARALPAPELMTLLIDELKAV